MPCASKNAAVLARWLEYISFGWQGKFIQLSPKSHHTHNKMLFCPLLAVCMATLAVASPAHQVRAGSSPQTPNQIIDDVIDSTVKKIAAMGWDVSKNLPGAHTNFNINVGLFGKTAESFDVSSAKMTGIGSLVRSGSWEFTDTNQKIIIGTLRLVNARASVDYKLIFPGVDAAPAQTIKGKVVEKADNIFADVQLSLNQRLVPQSILKFTVRTGHESIESSTGLTTDSKMAVIDIAGIRGSLVHLMEDAFNTSVKEQINKAVQDWKIKDSLANP